MEAPNERPAHVLPVPRWTLIIHAAQVVLAIIILGLDAYGIHWISYNALIFSLVTAILTLLFSVYIVGTSLFLHNLYNMYIVLGLHVLMVIFWIVDLGLVANLARIWSGPECSYSYWYGYYCSYGKRDLSFSKRDTTTVKSYYGALVAGAFFGAVEFATWVLCAVILVIYLNKHRGGNATSTHNPPAYNNNDQAVPMEHKYGQTGQPQAQPVYEQPQQQYSAAPTPQPQYAQPAPQGQYQQQPVYGSQQQYSGQYPQDPVNRAETVSPASNAGYSAQPQNTSELASAQHTGNHNPNASELSNQR